MNALITAGGTREPIDAVRYIANTGTGLLGSMIADEFMAADDDSSVTYICGKDSIRPKCASVNIIEVSDTASLIAAIKSLAHEQFDVIVHSMAVSDYSVKDITTKQALMAGDAPAIAAGKISSDIDDLILVMERTPKVISLIRDQWPAAFLIGFKLLDSKADEDLIDAAHGLLIKNSCNLVFANDAGCTGAKDHRGFLVYPDKAYKEFVGKPTIATAIVNSYRSI